MTDRENFLSRWSRLKRRSGESVTNDSAVSQRDESDAEPASPEPSPPVTTGPALQEFDPAELPSIESLTAESDILPFLQEGVPPELTRAALRTAWRTDPAIRDFIGIADSQWDFNDPEAMPGFSPLEDAGLAQRLQSSRAAQSRTASETLKSFENVASTATERVGSHRDGQVDKVWRTSGATEASISGDVMPSHSQIDCPEVEQLADEASQQATSVRRHGSALPK